MLFMKPSVVSIHLHTLKMFKGKKAWHESIVSSSGKVKNTIEFIKDVANICGYPTSTYSCEFPSITKLSKNVYKVEWVSELI